MANIVSVLERELGAKAVVGPGNERLETYGRDESQLIDFFPPVCAALVESTEQAAAVLRLCLEHEVPVTPRGAGSGFCGGSVPVPGGIVLSTEKMTRILAIDPDDLVAVVEPGVITGQLQAAVEEQGMFYPPDPASLEMCSIGGNAATNAGGPRAFKYGVTREYVLGLEVALMGGEVLRCGRRTAKGVTGYDLVAGFVGTEGTFGVITELTLKLLPKPPAAATILAVFPDIAAAGTAINGLLRGGLRPSVLEIADRTSIDHVRSKSRYRFPANAGALVLIEVDGDAESMPAMMERIGMRCDDLGAIEVVAATEPAERRAVWEARRLITPALREANRIVFSEDVCVPRGRIVEMLARTDRVSAETKIPISVFGHAGDGNLHIQLLSQEDPANPAVRERMWDGARRIFEHTIAVGGTLSGEHGIGLSKRDFVHLEQSEQLLAWQRRWKLMWDPANLLNPGKKIPNPVKRCSE
ncbi:MAG TPA: FAD-linked oxidase C-terminal domain-containing protein [Kofleriaceae bacterium]|jgi:glycolate oxidase|nr:FAD-linked oxidase C-terminal domain-containing protein [Kofleriaceae bacterium]